MRIGKLCCLLLCCMYFVGCTGQKTQPGQEALDFRTDLMEHGGCCFTANIAADFGERVYMFTLACETNAGETRLKVIEPEMIAGIAATVSSDGIKLTFDDAELDFGKLANGYVSPVTVPWLLAQCWMGEYIAWSGADGELDRVTYLRGYDEAELTVDTWFSDGVPQHAEILYDDVRCLTVEILDFKMN